MIKEYDKLTPHQALQALKGINFKVLLAYVEERHPERERGVWKSALDTWLPWLTTHRFLPKARLPMVLPAGPVFELHMALQELSYTFFQEVCLLGANTHLLTVTTKDEKEVAFTSYRPIIATIERMKEAGFEPGYQGNIWITNRPPLGQIKAFTVTPGQFDHYRFDWSKLWKDLYNNMEMTRIETRQSGEAAWI
jgi:hypothetical protein